MTRHEQARSMFKQGCGIVEIAKELNTSWSQARGMADPDGEWRLDPVPKKCIGCGEIKPPEAFPRNHNNRDRHENRCRECCKAYVSQARQEINAAKYTVPDKLYFCPYCESPRQCHLDRPDYGRYFTSKAEAKRCCNKSRAGYRRIGARPTAGKYQQIYGSVHTGDYA